MQCKLPHSQCPSVFNLSKLSEDCCHIIILSPLLQASKCCWVSGSCEHTELSIQVLLLKQDLLSFIAGNSHHPPHHHSQECKSQIIIPRNTTFVFIVALKVFLTITHNTHIDARTMLGCVYRLMEYVHLRGVKTRRVRKTFTEKIYNIDWH